jgi:hypothetical protein
MPGFETYAGRPGVHYRVAEVCREDWSASTKRSL